MKTVNVISKIAIVKGTNRKVQGNNGKTTTIVADVLLPNTPMLRKQLEEVDAFCKKASKNPPYYVRGNFIAIGIRKELCDSMTNFGQLPFALFTGADLSVSFELRTKGEQITTRKGDSITIESTHVSIGSFEAVTKQSTTLDFLAKKDAYKELLKLQMQEDDDTDVFGVDNSDNKDDDKKEVDYSAMGDQDLLTAAGITTAKQLKLYPLPLSKEQRSDLVEAAKEAALTE